MEKTDLRTGMLVEHRNGDTGIVLFNTLRGDIVGGFGGNEEHTWYPLSNTTDDLKNTCNSEYDIVKIYVPSSNMHAGSSNKKDYDLVWDVNTDKKAIINGLVDDNEIFKII